MNTHQPIRHGQRGVIADGRRQIGCSRCRTEATVLFVTVGHDLTSHASCPACRDPRLLYVRAADDDMARRFDNARKATPSKRPWHNPNGRPVIEFKPEGLARDTHRAWIGKRSEDAA